MVKEFFAAQDKFVSNHPVLSKLPHNLSHTLSENFHQNICGFFVYIASADGALDDVQICLINAMLATNFTKDTLANVLKAVETIDIPNFVRSIVATNALIARFRHPQGGGTGELENDPFWQLIALAGQAFVAMARSTETHMADRLSTLTLAAKAAISSLPVVTEFHEPVELPNATKSSNTVSTSIDNCLREIEGLVGLESVKREVSSLINLAKVFAIRRAKNLPVPPMSHHLVFTGNPGTGKTTVARIIAKVYGALGLLDKGHLVEVDRSGLVGGFVGQTALKTKKVLDSAIGGVLFIDEAYSLAKGTDNDFGAEAVEVLLKEMEDHRDNLVVIVAGYDNRMEEFLRSNFGLRSRFSKTISFPDYSPSEMGLIFERSASQSGYKISPDGAQALGQKMQEMWDQRSGSFANARDVRNLFERVVTVQSNRVANLGLITEDTLAFIEAEDLAFAVI